jgi:hypothetical protein
MNGRLAIAEATAGMKIAATRKIVRKANFPKVLAVRAVIA